MPAGCRFSQQHDRRAPRSEGTARTIFPARRIARLEDGYQASFLVLGGDPVADFQQVQLAFLIVGQQDARAPLGSARVSVNPAVHREAEPEPAERIV